jgi:hypothetical protein
MTFSLYNTFNSPSLGDTEHQDYLPTELLPVSRSLGSFNSNTYKALMPSETEIVCLVHFNTVTLFQASLLRIHERYLTYQLSAERSY